MLVTLQFIELRIHRSRRKDAINLSVVMYVGVPISLWLFLFPIFLFAAQPKEFFLDGLKKLEQPSRKCVELRGEYVNTRVSQ
jgi:hypothetical protein